MPVMLHSAVETRHEVETPFPDSPFVVLKFGGRSVSTVANWERIHDLLAARLNDDLRPVVCHSALAGISNALLRLLDEAVSGGDVDATLTAIRSQHETLAAELEVDAAPALDYFDVVGQLISGVRLVGEVSPRVHARVLAAGELAATTLGAAYLRRRGLLVEWLDARDLLTARAIDDQGDRAAYLSARCVFDPSSELQKRLGAAGGIVLTQGFIARNEAGDTVLLGRGGSDTTGAYLAAKLEALRLEIWTDVPGFFSADPKLVPSARLIRTLHYQEAQEIASAGGGVLHPRSISPVRQTGIPLFLKSTWQPDLNGSVTSSAVATDTPQVKAISHRTGITLVSMESLEMWHQVGFLAEAFAIFRRHGLSVDLISTSESNVTVSIDTVQNITSDQVLESLIAELSGICRAQLVRDCAAITLVGRRIRAILHEISSVLELFREQKVHLLTQAASDLNLTFVVDSEHAYKLVQRLHALLVHRFAGGVFGATWAEIDGEKPATVQQSLPVSDYWWHSRSDELIAIAREHHAAYVYDSASIAESVRQLCALRSIDRVFYAMKANSHPDILRLVDANGGNLECVSPGEVRRVLDVLPDIDRQRILFTPNFAPRSEYEFGLEQGVRLTIDNLFVIREWGPAFKGAEIFIRVDTGQGRGHHEHVKTAGVHSKFGVPLFELEEFAAAAKKAGARVTGLHAHSGSGILDPDAWTDTAECLLSLRELFPDVRCLDIGGGLGIPEKPGQQQLDLAHFDGAISGLKARAGGVEFWIEPGRYVVGRAGALVAEVTQTKGKGEVQYVGVATGMNSLIRPALYGAYHEIVNLSRLGEAATEVVTVVGPICETADRLGSDRLMPAAQEGDVLLIANAGAYGKVMSSRYNLREEIPEILI